MTWTLNKNAKTNLKVAEVDLASCFAGTVGADLKLLLNLEDTFKLSKNNIKISVLMNKLEKIMFLAYD